MGWQEDAAQAPKPEVLEPRRVQMPKGRASDEIEKARRSDATQLGLVHKISPTFMVGLTGMTAARGLALIIVPFTAAFAWLPLKNLLFDWQRTNERGITVDFIVIASLFSLMSVAAILGDQLRSVEWPILFNRRTRMIYQMVGRKLRQVNWDKAVPFAEKLSGPTSQLYQLHLVESDMSGKLSTAHVTVHIALVSPTQAAEYYEYVRRYMEGEWDQLPETFLVETHHPVLEQFKYTFLGQWFLKDIKPLKDENLWGWIATFAVWPIVTLALFPLELCQLIGTRTGRLPKFPKEVLAQATYDPARDGEFPPELQARIKPAYGIGWIEKIWYSIVLVAGLVLWSWIAVSLNKEMGMF